MSRYLAFTWCVVTTVTAVSTAQEDGESDWWLRPHRMIQTNLREIDATMDTDMYVREVQEFGANVVLFPTLADLCTVQAPAALQGTSLRPLLEDPNTDWDRSAFTVRRNIWNGRPVTGRTIRTGQWRYTEWDGGREGRELYDHVNDPGEYRNIAEDSRYERVVRELSERLVPLVNGRQTDLH